MTWNDEELEELRKKAAAIAEPIHEVLMRDICRRVRKAGAITSTAEYQIYRAEQLGLAEKEIKRTIARQLEISDQAITMLFEELADETVLFEENAELRQLVEAYSIVSRRAAAADYENLWAPGPDGTLYTVKEAYGKIMDFAWMQTASGAYDFQTAVRRATQELVQRGIRTIPGKDGRSFRIEYAVRSYITNRMGEMFNTINRMNYEAIGADGWEISAHEAPAPDHAPYQGRQYAAREYEQINGSLTRKFGWWNCRHTVYPILLGISPPSYTEEQRQRYLDENEEGVWYEGQHFTLYEAKGRKRQLESMISQKKYDIMAAEGDPQLLREQQIRLQNIRREYERFCQATGQTPEPWRTMVAEYGRSRAGRDAWAVRKLGQKLSDANSAPDILYQLQYKNVSEQLRLELEQELAMLPDRLRALAESQFDRVIYDEQAGNCYLDLKNRELVLSQDRQPGNVIHEYGHGIERALGLYHNKKFLEIRNKGFENITVDDIIEDTEIFDNGDRGPVYLIRHVKLVSIYQGRLYEDYGIYDGNTVSLGGMREYFSEGFRCYFMEPELLKQKDDALYQFIRELVENEPKS
ncbi:MAG: phage minor capsid protein [Muribaculaceae bacterium]|nr:phage minor capsid protein [Muribaculaceae bacterium]